MSPKILVNSRFDHVNISMGGSAFQRQGNPLK